MTRHLEPGDWVTTTRIVPISITDHLSRSGIPSGSKGVITSRHGSRITVDFDAGWGLCTATVNTKDCRLVRRKGGTHEFHRRARLWATIRIGVALALSLPFLHYIAWYWWEYRTFNGIIEDLSLSAIYSIGDWIDFAFSNPVQTILYAAVLALLTRFAFGKRSPH